MGFLAEGVWHGGDHDQIGAQGWEPRREQIRGVVRARPQGGEELPAEPGRYHLITCPGCPLSHRVAIMRGLKGLQHVVTSASVRPVMGAHGREFGTDDAAGPDPVTGARLMHELYTATAHGYSGRDSTPVLWDRMTRRIVSNAYRDILAMLNREFGTGGVDVLPAERMDEIDAAMARLGTGLTGAVYRCGFSRDQAEYEYHANTIGRTVPELAALLSTRPFLLGDAPIEPDLALFACLVRFDAIYLPLFRCTRARIEDHPALVAFIRRMMALPGVAATFDLRRSMAHYFGSHVHLNPTRIVPLPPPMAWLDDPARQSLAA